MPTSPTVLAFVPNPDHVYAAAQRAAQGQTSGDGTNTVSPLSPQSSGVDISNAYCLPIAIGGRCYDVKAVYAMVAVAITRSIVTMCALFMLWTLWDRLKSAVALLRLRLAVPKDGLPQPGGRSGVHV